MCGIFVINSRHQISAQQVLKSLQLMRHRGPDDAGVVAVNDLSVMAYAVAESNAEARAKLPFLGAEKTAPCWLGHVRLSIIDLSYAGHQPFLSDDGTKILVFNGEIYNYKELRSTFSLACRTESDSEVLLKMYEKFGPQCTNHFVGMWAFAIYNVTDKSWFVSRDPYGIKPLYFAALREGGFVVASEIKAILPWMQRLQVNQAALYNFLVNQIKEYSAATFFDGICQLEPGCQFVVRSGEEICPQSYYELPKGTSGADAQDLRAKVMDSIRLHVRSDVPVGLTLSGGIDSTVIAASMAHQMPSTTAVAFSGVFPGEACDESQYIQDTVKQHGLRWYGVTPTAEDMRGEMDSVMWHCDEPFRTSALVVPSHIYRLARSHGIRVLLNGQGSDEIFGGYAAQHRIWLSDLFFEGKLVRFKQELLQTQWSMQDIFRLGLSAKAAPYLPMGIRSGRRLRKLLIDKKWQPAWLRENMVSDWRLLKVDPSNFDDRLRRDFQIGLRDYLWIDDRMSMRHSVETRVPFLNSSLVKFGLEIDKGDKIVSGIRKFALRDAFRDVLPASIASRKDKTGFEGPEAAWLLQSRAWVEEYIPDSLERTIVLQHVANSQYIAALKAGLMSPKPEGLANEIWRLVAVELWAKKYGVSI